MKKKYLYALVAVFFLRPLFSQCPAGKILVGEDEEFYYCAGRTDFSESAAGIISAFDHAAKSLGIPKNNPDPKTQSLNCSAFFRAVGAELNAKGDAWHGRDANDIIHKIAADTRDWRPLTGSPEAIAAEAQELANRGVIVVGTAEGMVHGHVGVVSPMPPDVPLSNFGGSGPMVRDGNVHLSDGKKKPSGWGSVRASYAFGRPQPTWYVWVPSAN